MSAVPEELCQRVKVCMQRLEPNQAWWEDPEMGQLVMEVFNCFQHRWQPKPGSTMHYALCTGFDHRGELPNDSGKPSCPGCAKKMRGTT